MAKRKRARTRSGQFTKKTTAISNPRRRSRRKARVNPGRARAYAARTIGGINLGGAVKASLPMLLGAMAAKFTAKKWGGEGGAETDNWTAKHYLFGALGGFAAAFVTSAVFRGSRATAQRVAEGAMLILGYKLFTNEIAPKNDALNAWFGADDEALPEMPANYAGLGAGDVLETPQGAYVLGANGDWQPVAGLGEGTRPVDPTMGRLGEGTRPVDPTMGRLGGFGAGDPMADFRRVFPIAKS